MIDSTHLVEYVIRPVLEDIGAYSRDAEELLLGTACKETECGLWLHQLDDGAAHGIYQGQKNSLVDNLKFLNSEKHLSLKIACQTWCVSRLHPLQLDDIYNEILGNLNAATVMCRVHYMRFAEPIPDTLLGQAHYWKTYYNTEAGAGTEEEYIAAWHRYVPSVTVAV